MKIEELIDEAKKEYYQKTIIDKYEKRAKFVALVNDILNLDENDVNQNTRFDKENLPWISSHVGSTLIFIGMNEEDELVLQYSIKQVNVMTGYTKNIQKSSVIKNLEEFGKIIVEEMNL